MTTIELCRIVFLFGAIIALSFKNKFGISPGGIIVPGIFALLLVNGTLQFIALLAMGILCYFLSKYTYGKLALSAKKFNLFTVLLSVLIFLIYNFFTKDAILYNQSTSISSAIVPALIAINMNKYGAIETLFALLVASVITYAFGLLLERILPISILSQSTNRLGSYKRFPELYKILLLLPVLGVEAFIFLKYKLKSGGYTAIISIAIVSVFSPIQAIMIIISIIGCFMIMNQILKYTDIIGLEKFTVCLFVSYFFVVLMDHIAIAFPLGDYRVSITIIMCAIASITNDLTTYSIRETVTKATIPVYFISCALMGVAVCI